MFAYDENSYMVKMAKRYIRSLQKNPQNPNQDVADNTINGALENNPTLQDEFDLLFKNISNDIFDGVKFIF